jgi:hypothetical protein
MSSPLCPSCRHEPLTPSAHVPDRMMGDHPATHLHCSCGYARWYQMVPAGHDRLEMVAAPRWWQEWSVLAAAIALIVIGSALFSSLS